MASQQVSLSKSIEPLQIRVPDSFDGQRTDPERTEIYITTRMTLLTLDEINDVVKPYLNSLPYPQSLNYGAVFIDEDDPLLGRSQEELDAIERSTSLPNSRYARGTQQRSTRERVLIIRERGYFGSGQRALNGSASK